MEQTKIYRNITKLKNVDMFYFDTKIEAPTIVCLHGRWGRAETWTHFINHYGKQYRIIAPDQRGHGLSSKPISKYTSEEMAEDIIELLDFLKIDSVILVGHSMGGAVAGHLTALYPECVKALVILDKSAAGSPETNNLSLDDSELKDFFTKDWPMPFATLNEAQNFIKEFSHSDLEYQYFMNSLVETVDGYEMMFSSQAMAANAIYDVKWSHLLSNIKCLTLLISKARNHETKSYKDFIEMQSLIPKCIAHEMSDPDHNVHLANKEEFYEYFDEFLKKL